MDERVMQFRVGVMFLATLLIGAILLVMFGKLPNLTGRKYTVQILFKYAPGVTNNTPVRKSGILIGRVENVELTEKEAKVLVTARLDSDKAVYKNEDCVITRDLLGDTALSFVPNRKKPGAGERITGDTILEGQVVEDPTGLKEALAGPIGTVTNTGEALAAASEQLGKAAKRVEDILDKQTEKDAKSVLADSAVALKAIREMLGDEENRKKLTQAMNRLPDTLDNMNNTFKATNEALQRFTDRTGPDQKTPIDRMVGTIEMTERTLRKFSESSEPGKLPPADQIAAAMENIGEITSLMRTIMSRIEQGDGSLGALLNDRQLYDRLNHAARNVEDVSRQLRPIVDDARVFMDKAARHPGVIIRDAVKPGVGIK